MKYLPATLPEHPKVCVCVCVWGGLGDSVSSATFIQSYPLPFLWLMLSASFALCSLGNYLVRSLEARVSNKYCYCISLVLYFTYLPLLPFLVKIVFYLSFSSHCCRGCHGDVPHHGWHHPVCHKLHQRAGSQAGECNADRTVMEDYTFFGFSSRGEIKNRRRLEQDFIGHFIIIWRGHPRSRRCRGRMVPSWGLGDLFVQVLKARLDLWCCYGSWQLLSLTLNLHCCAMWLVSKSFRLAFVHCGVF